MFEERHYKNIRYMHVLAPSHRTCVLTATQDCVSGISDCPSKDANEFFGKNAVFRPPVTPASWFYGVMRVLTASLIRPWQPYRVRTTSFRRPKPTIRHLTGVLVVLTAFLLRP
ncbi:hypothetical protein DPMN_176953 [Dreissena polymorpha]|uniref:Uncharacterized protein n=1 Tax=Dreissena polymorpha TaxID=45954 RepID=A0A9D4E9A4_DREPO|nr:hypothetical protein DPMN_176950 [Dreissena polymorpha]KAH3775549.1 hypothetical protein DPMN_176953 [Dreissena polymorpha]